MRQRIGKSLLTLLLFGSIIAVAQKPCEVKYKWGVTAEDSVDARKNYSIYRSYMKQKNYKDAYDNWLIVAKSSPKCSKNLYIDGVKLYKKYLIKEAADADKAKRVDELLALYDTRMECFGEAGKVTGSKGMDMYSYKKKTHYKEAIQLMDESISAMKNKSKATLLQTHVKALVYQLKKKEIECGVIVDAYGRAMEIIAANEGSKHASKYQKVKINIDNLCAPCLSCDIIAEMIEKDIDKKKSDAKWLKDGLDLLEKKSCRNKPVYITMLAEYDKVNPSADSKFLLGKVAASKKQYSKAHTYYKEALTMSKDGKMKVDIMIAQAKAFQGQAQYQTARDKARQILSRSPNNGQAYLIIADCYAYGAADACSSLKLKGTEVYWVAYDYYLKAKAHAKTPENKARAGKMAEAYKERFPDMEKVFAYGLKEGDEYEVNCWINEKTTIRPKK